MQYMKFVAEIPFELNTDSVKRGQNHIRNDLKRLGIQRDFAVRHIKDNSDSKQKTSSQKLRNSLFILWDQKYKHKEQWQDFDVFYEHQMARITDNVKKYID